MKARGIALAAVVGASIALSGCAGQEPEQPPAPAEAATEEQSEEFEIELDDRWDCENKPGDDERAHRETPDCGRYVRGRWVEWSWVSAGQTTPPPGWSQARESASDRSTTTSGPKQPTPQRSTKTTRPTRKKS